MMRYLLFSLVFCFSFSQSGIAQSKKENIALSWLNNNKSQLSIKDDSKFKMLFSRKGFSGETFRYYQMNEDVRVFDAEVTIHVSNNNKVTYHASTYDDAIKAIKTEAEISETEALSIAKNQIKTRGSFSFSKQQLFIYNHKGETILAYVISLEPNKAPFGSWEVIINANNSEIISTKNKALHYKTEKLKTEKRTFINGSGYVYETDPLTEANTVYGGNYTDNNDATNPFLDAARTEVTLLDITEANGQFFLKGPFAEIQDFQSPNKGLFEQASSIFNFNRSEDAFEAVNAYYHIDKSMRYINNVLGFNLTPLEYTTGVKVDPSGQNGVDNSEYLLGSNSLAYGEGCIDDAEDADVLLHELGHGLHHWLTNGSFSTNQGLSEGCGDYWANSYKRSLQKWESTDEAYYYVFGWDGHNEDCWPGRITNYSAHYPDQLVGGSGHTDGQIWASTLLEIWEIIGREKTDLIFLEGLAMTNSSSNQNDTAKAVLQAAIDIGESGGFTAQDIEVITNTFEARGYLGENAGLMPAIAIYPNPTSSDIKFKNVFKPQEVLIYNMLGQIVKTEVIDDNNTTINVSKFSNGAYFIRLNEDLVLRFIKE